jgi:hypothetical protein
MVRKRWGKMASERYFSAKEAAFQIDGGRDGKIVVANTRGFKVKAKIQVVSNNKPVLELEIKFIENKNNIYVGPIGSDIEQRSDLTPYKAANSATVKQPKQKRMSIPSVDTQRYVYEEEPTVAIRSILVDPQGLLIDENNPLPTLSTFIDASSVYSPHILNLDVGIVESAVILPVTVKKFTIRRRDSGSVKLSYTLGGTSDLYFTLSPGNCYSEEGLKLNNPLPLYLLAKSAGKMEVLYWE